MPGNAETLARFVERAGSVTVLSGAGVSTASGIPGYRDREGNWNHPAPVQFGDFKRSAAVRRRYWARSFAGWQRIETAAPNDAHLALADLERSGHLETLVTQNVDGLHHRAGNRNVIDLHGRLDCVRCLDCGSAVPRREWQARLLAANPDFQGRASGVRPDGDAEIGDEQAARFAVPDCEVCAGIMKPDVVFFGEPVPKDRVERARESVARTGALLIAGSSLMVFSGFRFARLAREIGKPIAILNQGRTRADDIADLRLDEDCGEVLLKAVRLLGLGGAPVAPAP